MAHKLEDLPVYGEELQFWGAVTAILDRAAFGRDHKLRDQISAAADSVLANMSEGFEQPTDAALERYLFISKASTAEVCTRLASAHRRGYIAAEELQACLGTGERLQRMLAGWIRYLAGCGWKDRGRRGTKHQGTG